MKVALIHDFLLEYGGAERVVEVFSEMFPKCDIFTLSFDSSVFPDSWREKRIKSLCVKLPYLKKYPQLYGPYLVSKIRSIDLSAYDLVISSDMIFAKMVSCPPKVKHLCYNYSPADMLYHFLPQKKKRGVFSVILTALQKSFLRREDYLSSQLPDVFITLSKFVGQRITKYYRREFEVIYPPVNITLLSNNNVSAAYYLIVSRLVPNKNIDIAVRCCVKHNIPLIVVGNGDEIYNLRLIAGPTVQFVTKADDLLRDRYYEGCKAVLMCNEEDFGITAVESMAHGKGVIAYGAGGALETVLDNITGTFFKELTPDSLYDGIKRFEELNIRREDCYNQSLKFSRQEFENRIRSVIDELIYIR